MPSLEGLNDRQRAVLALLLRQGKSYDDIAGLLGTDPASVRARAHGAVDALGPQSASVDPDRRREIADYLLGQQSASQRAATREYLEDSAEGRAWARAASAGLSSVAGEEALPDVPAEREEVAEAFDALEKRTARQEEVQRSSQLGGKLIAGGLGIVLAIIIIVVANPFSSDDKPGTTTSAATNTAAAPPPAATTTTPAGVQTTATTPSGDRFEIRAQGVLSPPKGSGSNATGQVAIVSLPDSGQFRLALTATGLAPSSTSGSAYGVWFYTAPGNTVFVGFPDVTVGADGKLETIADLDPKTPVFREVLLTRETSERPKQPGAIILRARLLTAGVKKGQTKTTP